jgi:uncharacterized SAM-binding protein YcdF (DUF218 family)
MTNRMIVDISNFIFVEDAPHKADAIMIVGGSHPELGEKAAELWKQGYAPVILASGGVSIKTGKFPGPKSKTDIYDKDYKTEYAFFTDVLLKNGVPQSAIYGEDKSSYTKENALYTKLVADENGFHIHQAILVCKAFHARRSMMFYQMAFPNVTFNISTVNGYDISKENWYKNDYGIQRVMGELSRCGNQFAEDFIKNKDLFVR